PRQPLFERAARKTTIQNDRRRHQRENGSGSQSRLERAHLSFDLLEQGGRLLRVDAARRLVAVTLQQRDRLPALPRVPGRLGKVEASFGRSGLIGLAQNRLRFRGPVRIARQKQSEPLVARGTGRLRTDGPAPCRFRGGPIFPPFVDCRSELQSASEAWIF